MPPSAPWAGSTGLELRAFRELLDATGDAISHGEWDTANAAFHEHQIDVAGNALLSGFYRELSVNLMMQVLRGGTGRGARPARDRAPRDRRGVRRPATSRPRRRAIREHIETGRRIAIEALERAGGVL